MKKIIIIMIFILMFIIIGTIIINYQMINSTKKQIISEDNLPSFDYLLVLGCRVNGNQPSMMLAYRLDKAYEVYQNYHQPIILSGDSLEDDYDEVSVMYNYLVNKGVSENDLILDKAGINTFESLSHLKEYGDVKFIIITQEYHMYRSLYLANQFNIEAWGVNANDLPYDFIMLKNKIREVLARDKNYFKVIIKGTDLTRKELYDQEN